MRKAALPRKERWANRISHQNGRNPPRGIYNPAALPRHAEGIGEDRYSTNMRDGRRPWDEPAAPQSRFRLRPPFAPSSARCGRDRAYLTLDDESDRAGQQSS